MDEYKNTYSRKLGEVYFLPELRLDQLNLRRETVYKFGLLPPAVVVWLRDVPRDSGIWTLVSKLVALLGDVIGSVALQHELCQGCVGGGGCFKRIKTYSTFNSLCFPFANETVSSQLPAPPVVDCSPPLPRWMHPKINSFFHKFCWSWCSITATERQLIHQLKKKLCQDEPQEIQWTRKNSTLPTKMWTNSDMRGQGPQNSLKAPEVLQLKGAPEKVSNFILAAAPWW